MGIAVPVRPFLRWAGSKRQLIPTLSEYWSDDYSRYLEPFAGSACLFFHIQPQAGILGDINTELILTYTQVRDNVNAVVNVLSGWKRSKDVYYRLRETDPSGLDHAERAARFIYLNRFCFNGLYRTNLKGKFNVPYGGEKSGHLPNADDFQLIRHALRNVELVDGDFHRVLEQAQPGDLVYIDPPFRVQERRVFHEYDASGFGLEDLKRLRSWLDKLDSSGVDFLVSYAECKLAGLLMEGFSSRKVQVRRNISGFARNRRVAGEILISNRRHL